IEGEILVMSPQGGPHVVALGLAEAALDAAFGTGFWARTRVPLLLGLATDPEPDVAVVPGGPRDYLDHPTTALLVVEVSDTTLAYDRGDKACLYAAAGIADYWVVDLAHRQLIVLRDPRPDPARTHGTVYSSIQSLASGNSVSPLAAPHASIAVADLLP